MSKRREAGGLSDSREYGIWLSMRNRCERKQDKDYANYGGRGIRVCERWQRSFLAFYSDMGPRPSPYHSIDRIDNSRGYEPENCRWTSRSEQNENTRRSTPLTYNGETLSARQWSERTGIPLQTIRTRMKRGRSPDEVLHRGSLKKGPGARSEGGV